MTEELEKKKHKIIDTIFNENRPRLTDEEIFKWARANMMMLLDDDHPDSKFSVFMSKLLQEVISRRREEKNK